MTRVKRGVISLKKRRNLLKMVKGFRWGRSTKERQAREAIYHAGVHALQARRKKKSVFRGLWSVRISAALAPHNISYSSFIGTLHKKNIGLNRKMLSEIAKERPETFERIVKQTT